MVLRVISKVCASTLHLGRLLFLLAAPLYLLMCTACTRLPPFSLPTDSVRIEREEGMCADARTSVAAVQTVRALADVTVRYDDQDASFRYVVVSKAPSQFRIDLLPTEGAFTLGMLVLSDQKGILLDAQKKTYFLGDSEEELTTRFLGFSGITREVVLTLLTGQPFTLTCEATDVFRLPDGTLSVKGGANHLVTRLDPIRREVVSITGLTHDGASVRFQAERSIDFDEMPIIQVSVFDPARAHVSMKVSRLSVNASVKDELFVLDVPPGYR
jgi:outer membrane lipoprotein-sorting protein